jgi:hypothetical protein
MAEPPLLGRALLRLLASGRDHEFLAGDLLEEFRTRQVTTLGLPRARRWYLRQVAGSAPPLLLLRLRRGELAADLVSAQLLVVGVLLGFQLLWGMVLSQVPLRAATLSPGSQAGSAVAAALLAAGVGTLHGTLAARRGRATSLGFPFAVVLAALAFPPLLGAHSFVESTDLTGALGVGALAGVGLARLTAPRSGSGRSV